MRNDRAGSTAGVGATTSAVVVSIAASLRTMVALRKR
jgi:hypothetical protein